MATNEPQGKSAYGFDEPILNDHIDPSTADKYAEIIIDEGTSSSLKKIAKLHGYTYRNIEYKSTGLEFRTPSKTWKLGGDCEDQTILLSSLLLSQGFTVRTVWVQNHVIPEVLLPWDPGTGLDRKVNDATDADVDFAVAGDVDRGEGLEGWWYPVDPEGSRFIGDLKNHYEEDYAVNHGDHWTWNSFENSIAEKSSDYGIKNAFNS